MTKRVPGILLLLTISFSIALIGCGGGSSSGGGGGSSALAIANATPPGGTVGTAYSYTFTATGGKSPYSWNIASGQLPAGLKLNSSNGAVTGTPTGAATASFTVSVKDANANTAMQAVSIVIVAAPSPTITSGNPPNGTVNAAYAFTFTASGGTQPYTWNITGGNLPGGLTLKVATGVLSGTPTASGAFNFTATVTDANAATASQAYTVNIDASLNSISVTPVLPSIDVAGTQQFTATGNYSDGSHQDLSASVTWSSSAPSMVSITNTGFGTALMTGATPATITATLGSLSGSTQMNVKAPNVITVAPALPVVGIGGSQNFTATGKFADGTTADLTPLVSWSSGATSIATVAGDGKATGVAAGLVSVTATNSGISGSATLDVTDKNFSNSSLNGAYAFTLVSFDSRGPVFEAGNIIADGNGTIISGVEDINASSVTTDISLSGSYAVTPDGRGTLTLTGNAVTRTFNVILKANSATAADTNGQLIQNDLQSNAIGTLTRQDASAFKNSAIANTTYAFRIGGIDTTGQISSIGLMTTDTNGTAITGSEDTNDAGTITTSTPFSGTIGSISSSTGRAIATVAGHNFAIYVISASQFQLVEIDNTLPAVAGIAESQTAVAPPASGGYVFDVDTGGTQGRSWIIGQFDFSGTTISDGVQLQDGGVTLNVVATGMGFVFDGTGRGTFVENTDNGYRNFVAYIVSPTKMYLMQLNDSHAASGTAELQQPGSGGFTAASLSGDFAFGAAETGESKVTFVGQFVFDGNGNFYGVDDLSQPSGSNTVALQGGTYTVSSNGQVIMTLPAGGQVPAFSLFLISPSKGLFLGTPDPDVNGVAESQ